MKHDDLIRRLCEASEGSAELSADHAVYQLGDNSRLVLSTDGYARPCLTTSLSAAWEEAERQDFDVDVETFRNSDGRGRRYSLKLWRGGNYHDTPKHVSGISMPCLVCAALLAAEGER
jgi:hypothetical protein